MTRSALLSCPRRGDETRDRLLPWRHLDAGGPQLLVRQRAVERSSSLELDVAHADRRQPRLDAELARELLGEFEPRALPRGDAVIQAGGRGPLDELPGRTACVN